MESNRTALYIYLPLDATDGEIEAAHEIIDRQFGSIDPANIVGKNSEVIVSNNATPGTIVNASATGDATTTTAAPTGLDADGLPWDARIHSSNQKFNTKGQWWAKRNTSAAEKNKVEAELRATMAAGGAVKTDAQLSTAIAGMTTGSTLPPLTAGLPPMPGAGANMPDPAYAALVDLIAKNTNSPANPTGRITDDWIKQVLTHYGVAEGNLQNLAHAPTLVAPIAEFVKTSLAS